MNSTIMRALLTLGLVIAMAGLTGCFKQQVVVDSNYNASKIEPNYTGLNVHIFGFIGISNKTNLSEVCPSGAGVVQNKTFLYGFINIQQSAVYCSN